MYRLGTLDDLFEDLDETQDLAVDTETIGLYGKIRLIQFYQRHWDKVLIVENPEPIDLFIRLNKLSDINLVFQFSSYDISTFQAQIGNRFIPATFDDTFYLARLAYPYEHSFSLDNIMLITLGYDPYKKHGLDKKKMQSSNWEAFQLTDDQLVYAAIDVFYLLDAFDKVSQFKTDINYKLDMCNVRKALDFQNNGFPVERAKLEEQYRSNLEKLKELDMPINVQSWQQVRPYVNLDGSNALTLTTAFLKGNTKAGNVVKAKKLLKQNSFMDKFITDDGRIYGHFAPAARSGRYTCKEQNLQQLPRKLKHLFGLPYEGDKVLLYADYPQLELRTIAAIVKEQVLIKLFLAGGDPHNYVAEALFGKDFTKTHRQLIKTYNFNLLYCGGAGMVQSILIRDNNTLRDIDLIRREIRQWKKAWPAIAQWQEAKIRSHRRGRLEQTPMGRRYVGKLLTDHANIENQGAGADVAKLALHYMYDDLKANDAMLCNFIHDSYIVEMERDDAKNRKVATLMRDAMNEAWFEHSKLLDVQNIPMPTAVKCGFNWGDIEKDDAMDGDHINYLFEVA